MKIINVFVLLDILKILSMIAKVVIIHVTIYYKKILKILYI